MLNLLDGYIQNSLPDWGNFSTNSNLCRKVDSGGHFLPFYGNTMVFLLDDKTRSKLLMLQNELYNAAGGILSDRLDASTFHMTLHDLINAPEQTNVLQSRMLETKEKVKVLAAQWRDNPPLRMRTTWLFNMVNTSVVLGLTPADEGSWQRLDVMYMELEKVVPLGYGMTPHITMAYFRPGVYSFEQYLPLKSTLKPVEWNVEMKMDQLVYQEFTDMNHYCNA